MGRARKISNLRFPGNWRQSEYRELMRRDRVVGDRDYKNRSSRRRTA